MTGQRRGPPWSSLAKILLRAALLSFLMASTALSAPLNESAVGRVACNAAGSPPVEGEPSALIANVRFGGGIVSFALSPDGIGVEGGKDVIGTEIQVIRFHEGAGCAVEQVDT